MHRGDSEVSAAATLGALRAFLFVLLVGGVAGTLAELLLSKHWDGAWQIVPLALLGVGLLVPAAWAIIRSGASLRVLQIVMLLFIASGFVGMYLHYDAKTEFALERHADLTGWSLVREAMKGSSPPLLAPGAMIGLGLIGLAWTFRHAALGPKAPQPPQTE